MTGSGKSYFIKTFITRASGLRNSNALILDWSGEYSLWVEKAGGKIIDFSKGVSFNILDCTHAKNDSEKNIPTPYTQIERILGALSIIFSLSSDSKTKSHIKNALVTSYEKFGLNPNKPVKIGARFPTISDALQILKTSQKISDSTRAILVLESLCYKNSPFLPSRKNLNLHEITSSGLVSINLSTLPSDEHRSLAALILLQFLKEKMRAQDTTGASFPKCIIVADEAWKIAQDENSDLVQILREGRKYSFSLIVASQNPTDISKTILSNCATLLIFRLLHHEFRESLLNSLNLPKEISTKIERFPTGRALCRMALKNPRAYDGPFIISKIDGETVVSPFTILVEDMELKIQKKELSKKLWGLGLTDSQISSLCSQFEQNDNSLVAKRLALLLLSFGLSRSVVLSFLRDLGASDSSLLAIFSRIEADNAGVAVSSLLNLVVLDGKQK